eukprot:6303253-Pyramimonas_sp.AAC.1
MREKTALIRPFRKSSKAGSPQAVLLRFGSAHRARLGPAPWEGPFVAATCPSECQTSRRQNRSASGLAMPRS